MKKNITINLCGRLYQIDEDAYELLSQYIETLRNYFQKQEGGEEIANDIEERVAELFDDLKAQGVEAITIEHVQGVIHQIGQVEEIAGEAADSADSDASSQRTPNSGNAAQSKKVQGGKKFFRDSQNKILAGVLAGCAQYYGGNANTWRWGYVIVCVVWFFILGAGPFSLTIPFEGFFGLLALPFALVSLPFTILPLLPYFLTAIFTPEAKTPEDVLQMKGKEVNPQNLAAEVQEATLSKEKKKSDVSAWDIFVGVLSIGVSTFLTIGFIIALCFFVAFLAAREMVADQWWNIYRPEDLQAVTIPAVFSGVMLLVSIGIPLYCSIHAAMSSLGKVASWHVRQRLIWFLLWVASLTGFVGCCVWGVGRLDKTQTERWDREAALRVEESVTDALGHVFDKDEWDYFEQNGWELITAENTDRYTYRGEWMTNDRKVRYLDAWNDNAPVVYTVRNVKEVEPGIYRLSAAVRANNTGRFIYLQGQSIDPETGDTTQLTMHVKEIPVFANQGGNIWECARKESDKNSDASGSDVQSSGADEVVMELVKRLAPQDRQRISLANHRKGFGWSYIYIDSVEVKKPSELFYGVTTDECITGSPATTGWFSAADFKLERIDDQKLVKQ